MGRNLILLTIAACLVVALATWYRPIDPYVNPGDIQSAWLNAEHRDAVEFLQAGGTFSFPGEVENVERDYLFPLMTRCKQDLGLNTYAMVDEGSNEAWGMVIEVPAEPAEIKERVLAVLNEADADYPGEIWVAEGDDWLAIEMIDPEEVAALQEAELAEVE